MYVTPSARTIYNTIKDLKEHWRAGTSKTSYGPKTDQHHKALPVSERRKAIKGFQTVFQLLFEKLDKHLLGL